MRELVCIIAVLGVLLVSCSESEEDPVLAELAWSVRCAEGSPDCSIGTTCLGPDRRRQFQQFDGEQVCPDDDERLEPLVATCALSPGEGQVTIRLSGTVARAGEKQYGMEITGLTVDPETDSILEPDRCSVKVFEDGALYYLGSCGEEVPSSEQPCQISNLNVAQDDLDISLRLRCENLRSTTSIGIDVGGLTSPEATLHFSNCTG